MVTIYSKMNSSSFREIKEPILSKSWTLDLVFFCSSDASLKRQQARIPSLVSVD